MIVIKKVFSLIVLIIVLTYIAAGLQKMRGGSASLLLSGQRTTIQEIEKNRLALGEDLALSRLWLAKISRFLKLNQDDSHENYGYNLFGKTNKKQWIYPIIVDSLYYTFILALLASGFALFYGIFNGIMAGYLPKYAQFIYRFNYLILSVPIFIIALFAIYILSLYLNLLPPGGTSLAGWYLLPVLALGLKAGTKLAIFVQEFIGREENKPYVLTAKAYGFSREKIYFVMLLKNISLPVLSFWLLDFASYMAGAAIIESIHSIPGMGNLLLKALLQYDVNLIIAVLITSSLLIYFVGLLQHYLDSLFKKAQSK